MRKKWISVLLAASMTILTACGGNSAGGATATAAATAGGNVTDTGSTAASGDYDTELHIAVNMEAPMLDTHISTAAAARRVSCMIYECLFELDENFNPQMQLLESYETEDNKTWIFHLRQGVLFHNGKEMKAEDVCASMNRWTGKNTTAKKVFTANEQFEVVDDYTVKLVLEKSSVMLPYVLATPTQSPIIMPKEVIDNIDPESGTGCAEYIGTGPMKFVEWVPTSYIHLTKNEDYTGPGYPMSGFAGDKEINYTDVYYHTVTDATIRVTGLQTGEYDLIEGVSSQYLPVVESDSSLQTASYAGGHATIIFNKKEGYFTDEKLRQAVNLALNIDEIVAADTTPKMVILGSYMPEVVSTWYNDVTVNTKNVEEAKKLVAESGYDGGELVLLTTQTYPQYYDICLVIEKQLESIGLNVKIDVYDWATMLTRTPQPDLFDFYYVTYPTVSNPLSLMFLNSGSAGWTNFPELTEYFEEMNAAATIEEAVNVWSEAQEFCAEKVPMIKLYDTYAYIAMTDKLENLSVTFDYNICGSRLRK